MFGTLQQYLLVYQHLLPVTLNLSSQFTTCVCINVHVYMYRTHQQEGVICLTPTYPIFIIVFIISQTQQISHCFTITATMPHNPNQSLVHFCVLRYNMLSTYFTIITGVLFAVGYQNQLPRHSLAIYHHCVIYLWQKKKCHNMKYFLLG